jgi:D-serine deaminase-like pyridoxal phosphate-dependent protein
MSSTHNWTEWRTLLEGVSLPAIVVDQAALRANIRSLVEEIASDTVALRLFAPDLPCPALLRQLLLEGGPHVHGLACRSAREAEVLSEVGFHDLFVLSPVSNREDASRLAKLSAAGTRILVLSDHQDHLNLLSQAAVAEDTTLHVCIDVDIRAPFGTSVSAQRPHSSIRDSEQARELADATLKTPGLELDGIRTVDPGSQSQGSSWLGLGRGRAHQDLLDRRLAVVQTLRTAGHDLPLVSGGPCQELRESSEDPALTEIEIGRACLGGTDSLAVSSSPLQSAFVLALPVSQRPDTSMAICASAGLSATDLEVLTPLGLRPIENSSRDHILLELQALAPPLKLGDPVLFQTPRPSLLMNLFDSVELFDGEMKIESAATLRSL